MRISSLQIYSKSVDEMLKKQANVSDIQVHVASGKKIFTPSDDPVGASKVLFLKEGLKSGEIYIRNCNYAKNNLAQQENVLKSGINIIQRISELTVQAGNSMLSNADRYAIVAEINVRKNELLDLSNSKDSNGDYFFSGFKSNTPAVKMDNLNNYIYQGDDGRRQLTLGSSTEIVSNLSGKEVFFNIENESIVTHSYAGIATISSLDSGLVNSASLSSLSNIDLIINRTNILGSQSDKVSTTDGSASALAFANAINALQSEHKISASALQNQVNLGIFTSGVISAGQLSINQVPMIDPVGTDISLINTINLQSGVTGVIATQPGGVGTAILLNAEDGRNIQIKTNGSSTASFANFDMSSGLSLDKVQRAGIMLRSSSDIEISGAHPEKTGVSAGDFSVLSNTGTGKLQASVVAPITDLNTTYSIVFNNSGQSFSIYDDKMPSKPVEGFENLDYIPGQKISFQSFSLSLSGAPQPGDVFNLAVEKPAFQDVFKTIDTLTKAIKNNQNDASCLIYEVGLGLSNLNNVLVNFSKVQSIVGANLNVADSQVDIHAQSELITREFLSQIEDLDYAKALSDLTQASFVLEAAQKSFVHIQSLSIFNYLRS